MSMSMLNSAQWTTHCSLRWTAEYVRLPIISYGLRVTTYRSTMGLTMRMMMVVMM
jgi:hypothetical protein